MRFFSGVSNYRETPYIISDTFANKASYAATTKGALYIARDGASLSEPSIYQANGSIWVPIGSYGIGTDATLEDVTTNGNTTDKGIQITAGGLSTNSLTDTGLTAKSVPFVGTGGLITQDNTNFVWDNTNKWLGIQTNTPTAELDLHSSTLTPMIALNNVASRTANIVYQSNSVSKWSLGNTGLTNAFTLVNNNLSLTALSFKSADNSAYFSGFVGINQSAPSYNLDVNGITNLGGVTNIQTGNNLFYLQNNGATTGWTANKAQNTGGSFVFGLNGSAAGGISTGATAYATVINSLKNLELYSGGVKRLTLDESTGESTFVNTINGNSNFFLNGSIGLKIGSGSVSAAGFTTFHSISGTGLEGIGISLSTGGGAQLNFQSTGNYGYTYPATTGTIALTSNLSAYLPLAGGTLTGALSGTSGTFSQNVISNGGVIGALLGGSIEVYNSGNSNYFDLKSTGGNFALRTNLGVSAVNALTIAANGAATFINSITVPALSKFWDNTQGLIIGAYTAGSGFGAIYASTVTPSSTNYSVAISSTQTTINAVNEINLEIGSTSKLRISNLGNCLIGSSTDDTVNKLQVTGSAKFTNSISLASRQSFTSVGAQDGTTVNLATLMPNINFNGNFISIELQILSTDGGSGNSSIYNCIRTGAGVWTSTLVNSSGSVNIITLTFGGTSASPTLTLTGSAFPLFSVFYSVIIR